MADFRNYASLDFHPGSGLNVLVGMNGQGKSAVLEAIYMLATSKSHRTSRDTDMIRLEKSSARSLAEVIRSARNDVTLEIILSRTEDKTVKVNTVRHSKIGDIVGELNAVIFSTTDLDMVKGEPSRRRRFLNLEISQIRPQYVYALGRYKRVLDQRNSLLREVKIGTGSAGGLDVWNNQLAGYGATIIARRAEFVNFLSNSAAEIYSNLTSDSEELGVRYQPNPNVDKNISEPEIAAKFVQALSARREFDILRATTSVGPHRDDVILTINGLSAREYASQGQQRSAAIALKLAEISLMEESTGESPVVLLDDVMGELDENRRARILELILGRCQTFVTTTHLSDIAPAALESADVFRVASGEVIPQ